MNRSCVVCLYDLPLFKGLEVSAFGQVCIQAAKLQVTKGQCVFRQGDAAETVYLIKTGAFKLVRITDEGREVIADVLGPGEVMGETALFQEQAHPFSAVALELSRVCCFNRRQFEDLIRANPDVAMQVIRFLAHRLYENIQFSGERSGASVREKILQLLSRLAEKYGHLESEAVLIELDLTQQEIADWVGASRVMVANTLKQLHDEGIVRRHERYYWLTRDVFIPPAKDDHDERNIADPSCPAYHSREFFRPADQ